MNIVIFGATSAIAQAVARLYAKDGANFFLVARKGDRLNTVASDLRARGAQCVTTQTADLTDRAGHAQLVALTASTLGTIDRVLLAYGTLGDQRAGETNSALMEREIHTNFLSVASLLTELANVMEPVGAGNIAVIGSVAGDRGRQSNYIYGSAKAGLAAFTLGLRHRLAPRGVSVTLVKPGFVDTPMTEAIAKRGPLWAAPDRVARDIRRGLDHGVAVIYTPWFWRWIMLIVCAVPDAIFRRIRL